jgi:hypothetical protein
MQLSAVNKNGNLSSNQASATQNFAKLADINAAFK